MFSLSSGIAFCAVLLALTPPQLPDIEVFVQLGCPHCARAKVYLAELRREQPDLVIVERDIAADPDGAPVGAAARRPLRDAGLEDLCQSTWSARC